MRLCNIPGLYQSEVEQVPVAPCPTCGTIKNVSKHCQVSWGTKSPPVENRWVRGTGHSSRGKLVVPISEYGPKHKKPTHERTGECSNPCNQVTQTRAAAAGLVPGPCLLASHIHAGLWRDPRISAGGSRPSGFGKQDGGPGGPLCGALKALPTEKYLLRAAPVPFTAPASQADAFQG